jgi:hypothetical protein
MWEWVEGFEGFKIQKNKNNQKRDLQKRCPWHKMGIALKETPTCSEAACL